MLSRNLEQTLHRALSTATTRKHEFATLEHLLLSLTEKSLNSSTENVSGKINYYFFSFFKCLHFNRVYEL